MSKNESVNSIELYVNKIDRLLPYSKLKKTSVLEGLRKDVTDAMRDSNEEDPSLVFGFPRDVAKNLSQSQDWVTERASWRIRALAWFLDNIIKGFFVVVYFIGGIFFSISLFMPVEVLLNEIQKAIAAINWFTFGDAYTIGLSKYLTPSQGIILLSLFFFILMTTILFNFGYHIVLEYYFSATIAKKLLKLSVVDESGIKITWQQAIIRNVTKTMIDGFLLFDLILGMVLEKQDPEKTQKQRGMDILAETIVVKQK
ncbi:MAG: RDD family protein [Candidatus Hodarchaeales archaeon]|jgi:uncharacterized RDD family membrane protein YckC